MVIEIPGETLAIALKLRLRQGEALPGRQVLQPARGLEHVAVHEEKIHARTVAVLARPAGISLLLPRTGLPAEPTQGVLFFAG
ncbi:hypothetical protein D9M71_699280 [compost metagenome]